MPYPLLFKPIYRDYIWGGNRIASQFSRDNAPSPCAESWEISAHPDGMGIVENGPLAGKTLEEICNESGTAFLGTHCEGVKFPLLVKIIDAKTRLSVQVHPNEDSAQRYGGEAKTEMWYFLDSEKDAFVCAGLKPGVGPRVLQDAIKSKTTPSLLQTVRAESGKALFIPGGFVHAICEGCFILEVQQSSNTTYRIYDWDRAGPDGMPRRLHIEQALEVIDWKAPSLGLQVPIEMSATNKINKRERILRSDFFTMERLSLSEKEPVEPDGTSFRILFAARGEAAISWDEGSQRVPNGRTCLIPANMPPYVIEPDADGATLISVEV